MFQNNYGDYDADLVRIAMAHAASLVGNCGFAQDDADDILQTLIIAGYQALTRFDPSKAKRSTYLYAVIRGRVANLARDADRAKRDRRKDAFSLDAEWPGDASGETPWHDVVGSADMLPVYGGSRKERTDLHGLRIDLAEAIADLPPKLRELCRLHSLLRPEEARRAAGMAHSTHGRAVNRIRKFLESRRIFHDSAK